MLSVGYLSYKVEVLFGEGRRARNYSRLPQGMARNGSLSHNLVSRCVKW